MAKRKSGVAHKKAAKKRKAVNRQKRKGKSTRRKLRVKKAKRAKDREASLDLKKSQEGLGEGLAEEINNFKAEGEPDQMDFDLDDEAPADDLEDYGSEEDEQGYF